MKTLIMTGGLLLAIAMANPAYCDSVLKVDYDAEQDRLAIQAEEASLRKLLAVISLQTGIQVSMAPGAEQHVTLSLENQPLERGLKQMARQLNLSQAMYYSSRQGAANTEPLLIGVKVVPTGKDGKAAGIDDAVPVVNLEQEAVFRSRPAQKAAAAGVAAPAGDYAHLRWEDRLKALPDAKRTEIETMMVELREKRAERIEEIKAKREKRRADREAKREEREERRARDLNRQPI